jgi:hypothetical protein
MKFAMALTGASRQNEEYLLQATLHHFPRIYAAKSSLRGYSHCHHRNI